MSLEIVNVSKQFRDVKAVDDLSLEIPRGTMFGFLGPNGAGKTTTLRMVLGIIKPDTGRVLWDGKPFGRHVKGAFGYLPEERGLYPKMRVDEHLVFLGEINGLDRATAKARTASWIDRLQLGEYRKKRVEELSKGNQQKVQTIGAMLHEPEILFLDEPFSGLDPVNLHLLKEVLVEANRKGQTVVFSSHRMDQVEELCRHVCIIHRGRLVLKGELDAIKRSMGRRILKVSVEGRVDFWEGIEGLTLLGRRADYTELRMTPGLDSDEVLKAAMAAGKVLRFEISLPSLDQIFIEKVGDAV